MSLQSSGTLIFSFPSADLEHESIPSGTIEVEADYIYHYPQEAIPSGEHEIIRLRFSGCPIPPEAMDEAEAYAERLFYSHF